ncbi:MAG: acyl-CoA dehydrogenase C-terminal domain-containing protein, partial [Pseudomonadota bacterium]|nr:acyl-CoA dehydrogenase C-terminal domain-containing protein [Pseudomonadota bacterium]
MRSLSGPKNPDGIADPIIVHPDVRRMLLSQKAIAEGARALVYLAAQQADVVHSGKTEEEKHEADALLGFLTPIAKAFLTEIGFESANLGMQVFGGHGFISEWGMEQNVRDARIGMIYEGTTGIQALDLLGRKVLMTQGESLKRFTRQVHVFCKENADNEQLKEFIEPLAAINKEWGDLTTKVGMTAMKNREEVGAASVDYLMYSGYAVFAYLWARMAKVALDKMADGTSEEMFYSAKVQTARFYFKRMLPRARGHAECMLAGSDSLLDMPEEAFAF